MKAKLKEIAEVQAGYSFRSRVERSKLGETGVIQMKDLAGEKVVCKDLVRVELEDVKAHHIVQQGDLVFRSRGSQTTSAIMLDNSMQAVISAPLLRIRVKDLSAVLPGYLNWFIGQRDAQRFFSSRSKGTGQKMISKKAVEELEVELPGIEKQKEILELAELSRKEQNLLNELAKKRDLYVSEVLLQCAKENSNE